MIHIFFHITVVPRRHLRVHNMEKPVDVVPHRVEVPNQAVQKVNGTIATVTQSLFAHKGAVLNRMNETVTTFASQLATHRGSVLEKLEGSLRSVASQLVFLGQYSSSNAKGIHGRDHHGSALIRTLLCVAVIGTFLGVSWLLHTWIRARKFARFARENNCSPPSVIPNAGFGHSFRHKAKTVRFRGDVLDDLIYPKYVKYGSTYALLKPVTNELKAVFTIEPANAEAILSSKAMDFMRAPRTAKAASPFLRPGLGTSSDQTWHRHRTVARPHFNQKRLRNIDFLEDHVQSLFNALGSADPWTKTQDILPLMYNFTLDAATEFLFGNGTQTQVFHTKSHENMQHTKVPFTTIMRHLLTDETSIRSHQFLDKSSLYHLMMEFGTAYDKCLDYVGIRYLLGDLYWLVDGWEFRQNCWKVNAFIDYFVQDAAARAKAVDERGMDKSTRRFGLIDEIIRENEQNLIDLRNQCMHLLIAGRDTTSALLAWIFALLEKHPKILQELRHAILDTFGSEDNIRQPLTYDSLRSCEYLQWTIKEGMRLYPSGQQGRVAVRDTVLPRGGGPDGTQPLAISKGTFCAFPPYLLHRRKDIWGEDAWDFRPDRWQHKKHTGWEFVPFGGGPHSCLGRKSSPIHLVP